MNTLYIGHNVEGSPTWSTAEIVQAYQEITGRDGCTAISAAGWWKGQAEATTILIDVLPMCRALVVELAWYLNQEAILWDNGHGPAMVRPTPEEVQDLEEIYA